MSTILRDEFLREMEEDAASTRKCIERVPETLYGFKPHEKSMPMGYLTLIVADIPKWIRVTAEGTEIDFAKWEKFEAKTTAEMVNYYDKNMKEMKEALSKISDEDMNEQFHLKMNGQILFTSSKRDSIASSIRHWAHHRGQLTVYMRLNNIPVPSIYGPTADEKTF